MLNLQITEKNGVNVMSSLDLAKLCVGDKKDSHSDFMKKAKKVLGEGLGKFSDTYLNSQNKELRCLMLPEREACLMAMSYSYELQAKVYDEWKRLSEKEVTIQPLLPATYKEALLALVEEVELREKAEAESSRLQGVCETVTKQFVHGGLTPPEFCKQLNGVNIKQVQTFLGEVGLLLKTYGGWSTTTYSRDKYFTERHVKGHQDKPTVKIILTQKGAEWLYRKYLKDGLPMKKVWNGEYTHGIFESSK